MAQGQFTKQEAEATKEAFEEIFKSLSRNKKLEFLGHYNDIQLFLEVAKRNAPDEGTITMTHTTVLEEK